jgi:hypothetical protein
MEIAMMECQGMPKPVTAVLKCMVKMTLAKSRPLFHMLREHWRSHGERAAVFFDTPLHDVASSQGHLLHALVTIDMVRMLEFEHGTRLVEGYDPEREAVCICSVTVKAGSRHTNAFLAAIVFSEEAEDLANVVPEACEPTRDGEFLVSCCAACGAPSPNLRTCGACRCARYCDAECQTVHRKAHRALCRTLAGVYADAKDAIRADARNE